MITYLEQDFIDKAPQGEAVNTLIDLSGVSLITVPNYQKRLVIEVNSEYIYFSAATSGDVKPDVGVGYWNQYVVAATGNTVITGNTNEVVFNISGDTFGTDNNLYWDNATKKLGIGGIIPTRPLEVRASNGSLVGSTMTALVRISSPDEAGGFNMGYLNSEVIGAISSQGANSGLAFLTHNGVWDERIRIDTTGKVGIGTTSPNEGLEMGSDLRIRLPSPASFPTRPYLNIGARDAGDATALVFVEPSDDSELGGWIVGTGAMSFYTNSTSGRDIIFTTVGSNDIYFKTNNVERVRINSDGFVGIGTDNPITPLHVTRDNNSATIISERTGTFSGDDTIGSFQFRYAGDSVAQLQAIREGANDAAAFVIKTQSAGGTLDEEMRIDSNGKVGIGTTSPTEKLDVSGNTNISGIYMVDGVQIGIGDISGLTESQDAQDLLIAQNASDISDIQNDFVDIYDVYSGATILLEEPTNWNAGNPDFDYSGSTITNTFQGQQHYDSDYFFIAVDDNIWLRLMRG